MNQSDSLPPQARNNYVVISPVKDEGRVVETAIQAMLNQTLRPSHWIIVDDGSRDQTPQIIKRYVTGRPWITVLRIDRGADRQPGPGIMRAFTAGYQLVRDVEFRFIVKLDLDLDFAPDYFEQLLSRFHADKTLGIASGVYLEKRGETWDPIRMPDYHAAGACKVLRAECFRDIGGFVPQRGWDTIDEIRAQSLGWRTRHFPELQFFHLKKEGTGIGRLRTALMSGQTDYLCGAGSLFFALKVAHRMASGDPFLFEGLMFLVGYTRSWLTRKPRLVTKSEAEFYRNLLNERMRRSLREFMARWLRPARA